jgi:hypothetical protein
MVGLAIKSYSATLAASNQAIKANDKADSALARVFHGGLGQEYRMFRSSVTRAGPSSAMGLLFGRESFSPHIGNVGEQARLANLNQMAFHQAKSGGTGSFAAGVWDGLTWTSGKPFLDRMERMHKLKKRFSDSASAVLGDNSLGVDAMNDAWGGRISTGRKVLNKANGGDGSVRDIMPQAAANIQFLLGNSKSAPEIVNAVNMASSTLDIIKKREEEQKMWDSLPENYEPIRNRKALAMARETLDVARIQQWNRQ